MSEEIPKYRLRSMFPLSTLNSHIACTPWLKRGSSLSRNALICRRTASSASCIWCGCTSGPGTFCGLRQIPRHLLPFSFTGASLQNGHSSLVGLKRLMGTSRSWSMDITPSPLT